MLPLQSYYGYNIEQANLMKIMDGGGDSSLSSGTTKSEAASKSHSEAERRRRQRINAHLSTLRTLLPSKIKTDKASLLAEVVQHVKELRQRAADMAGQDGDGCFTATATATSGQSESSSWPFPTETDDVSLSFCGGDGKLVKATVCCEDRPGLNRDLTQAIRSVRARAVKAEMTTVGGRTKSVVVMQFVGGGGWEEEIGTLKRALKAVVDNRISGSGLPQGFMKNKRGRFGGSFNGDGLLVNRI